MQIKITIKHHFYDIESTKFKEHEMPSVSENRGNALLLRIVLYVIFLKCNFTKCFKWGTAFDQGIPLPRRRPRGNAKAVATHVPCRPPR